MQSLLSSLDRLLAPPPDHARAGWLKDWVYAHRGLHGRGLVENSPSAFRAAVEVGLGIECDVQRSRDGVPMIFHDWDLSRLAGRPEPAAALMRNEWRAIRLGDSDDAPFDLAELLSLVAGKVPLMIEIKSRPGYDVERSCEPVAKALQTYTGLHAVMSFDPRVSRWLRHRSPQTVRGLVVREDEHGHTQRAWQRHLALWIAKPDFVAYHVKALPNAFVAGLRDYGMPVPTWTVASPNDLAVAHAYADALIAEGAGLENTTSP